MPSVQRHATSPEYTDALARGLAALLAPGDVVLLEGELGAGKTTFVRVLAKGLGVDASLVASPTFVIVHVYPALQNARTRGVERLVHIDAYRLTGSDDLDALGWDQLFRVGEGRAAADAIACVEWPGKLEALGERFVDPVRVTLRHAGESARLVTMDLPESWTQRAGVDRLLEREPTRCRTTGAWVEPTSPTYPFASKKAQDADLFQWFTGGYRVGRPASPEDGESGEASG